MRFHFVATLATLAAIGQAVAINESSELPTPIYTAETVSEATL